MDHGLYRVFGRVPGHVRVGDRVPGHVRAVDRGLPGPEMIGHSLGRHHGLLCGE